MSAPGKNEFPLIQFDGDATWRRALSTTGWDVLGYGLHYKAKFISKSDYYKEWKQSYTNRKEDLVGPITATDRITILIPHFPIIFFALTIFPFRFYWFFFVYLLK